MSDTFDADMFAGAIIEPEGIVQTWDDGRRPIVKIRSDDKLYWFTEYEKYEDNGYDFSVVIQYFGFFTKGAAGTQFGEGRDRFTAKQSESAKKRIIEYYSGPEDKKVLPFTSSRTHFRGVIFEDGWILIKKQLSS